MFVFVNGEGYKIRFKMKLLFAVFFAMLFIVVVVRRVDGNEKENDKGGGSSLENSVFDVRFKSVREQYEAFPYPPTTLHPTPSNARGKRREAIVLQSPSHLTEINHYIWKGRRNFCDKGGFRILVAGGGTGEKTIQLATQVRDMKGESVVDIVHLDLSTASIAIAKNRVESLGLERYVRFFHGSITEDARNLKEKIGVFDYIDCLGVLHHLENPSLGIENLKELLSDDGGMGLMFYGSLGRRGIYDMQRLLKLMDVPPTNKGIKFVREFVSHGLPPTNWLRNDPQRWQSFNRSMHASKDAQIVDMLMPFRDVAYRVDQVFDMVKAAGMKVLQLLQPAIYRPETYVRDPDVLSRIPTDPKGRASFAELLAGNMYHHFLYVAKRDGSAPGPFQLFDRDAGVADDVESAIPVPHIFDTTELSSALAKWPEGTGLPWSHRSLQIHLPIPRDAAEIVLLMDGRRTLAEIYEAFISSCGSTEEAEGEHGVCGRESMSFKMFLLGPFGQLFDSLNGINKLHMAQAPVQYLHDRYAPWAWKIPGFPKNPYHSPARCYV